MENTKEQILAQIKDKNNFNTIYFKPFLITYEITRQKKGFSIDQTSNGWVNVMVSQKKLIELINNPKGFYDLDWK